jgi:hypothetical protein
MGNVECCRKPNNDDNDLKRSTIKTNIKYNKDIYDENEQHQDQDLNIIPNYDYHNEKEEKKNMDLDYKNNNTEHLSTLGPKDNTRNKNKKNSLQLHLNNENYYAKYKTENSTNNKKQEDIKRDENININNHINDDDNMNRVPVDRNKRKNASYEINNKPEKESFGNQVYQSFELVNNSNYIPSQNSSNDNYQKNQIPQKPIQDNIHQDSNYNNRVNNISSQNSKIKNQNDILYQQNMIDLQDYQQQDSENPKDSNEVYQRPNLNLENINKNSNVDNIDRNYNEEIKEAYIQNPDGQIFPTKQLSNLELALLYNQCLSNGQTEPDDDFSTDNYKKFYKENDPFFTFDKGEVSQGQIIASPDDINHLEIYEGEINDNNKKHGFGISTTPLYVRKGTWRDGEFTGWGRESRRNRDVLEGRFINGLLNGKGILKTNKGNIYEGDFVNSLREGYGILKTNRIHYIGQFKDDKLNGKGIIEFLKEGHKYEGDFKDNEINGKGKFMWKNGDVYEGEMTNGKMNGYGTYKYTDGQIYEGNYINGIREGKGRIIYSNKILYEGEFKGGHRYEKGNIIYSTRMIGNNNENFDNNMEYQ